MFVSSIGFTSANPMVPPPMISEIYFDSTNWFIELSSPIYWGYDSIRMISHSDTAYLSLGDLLPGQVRIITQDSLQTPFQFNRIGDVIMLQEYYPPDDWVTIEQVCWGTCSCISYFECNVNAPLSGQSLVMQEIQYYGTYVDYWLVKDNSPSLGTNTYQATSRGTFCGYIRDHAGNPINNILLRYCPAKMLLYNNADLTPVVTNSNGYFSNTYLFARNYNIIFCNNSPPYNSIIFDTIISITIEPDSINYYEFIIDTILTGIKVTPTQKNFSLTTFPNPTIGETTISFEIPKGLYYSKALIKIYNSKSEIISILPVNTSSSQNKYLVKWNSVSSNNYSASGIYYYNLELDGQKVASNKIILTK